VIVSALVTLLNLALSALVGVRLLLRARHPQSGPEIALAVYFLGCAVCGSTLSITVYSSLGDNGFALTEETTRLLVAAYTLCNSIGGSAIYVFTWRTFRMGQTWPIALVAAAVAAIAAAYVHNAAGGNFSVAVLPGPAYWVERGVFLLGMVWMSIESLRYWAALRRRARIGLAEPLLCNRLLLWGVWAATVCLLASSDLIARLAYVWMTGETVTLLVDEAMPIIVVTVVATSIGGAVAAAALWLTFFPTRGYARWIESRHAAQGAG